MLKRLTCLAVLAAFVTLLPTGYADPRDGWNLESRVPDSAWAMVSIEDVGGMTARFEKTAIAGLFREPEMQAFLAPIEQALNELVATSEGGPFGEATPLIMDLLEQLSGLKGQLALCLLEVDERGGSGMPRAVASLDFGPNVGDFAAFLERMRQQMDPRGNAIKAFQRDGRTYWANNSGDGPPVTATTVDTAFVVATDPNLLDDVVAGGVETPLGDNENYLTVRRKAGGGSLALLAYANVPAILKAVGSQMPDEMRVIADALGLDTVQAAAYGMAFAGDGFMDSFILHAPGADHGLVTMLEMPSYQPRALTYAPANAFYFEESRLNADQLLPNIRRLVAGVDPDAVREMDEGLGHVNAMLGVNLEQDILGGLAGGFATYLAMPDTGGLYPEMALFVQAKDATTFEASMAQLARGIAGAVTEEGDVIASTRTLDYRGQKLHLFEMQAARGDDVVPFTPTWTMLDDWCVITLVPHAMKEIVLRAKSPTTGGGLAAQEDFQSLQRVMPPNAGAMTYVDLQALMNLFYDTAVPVLQTAVKPNVIGREIPFPIDWAQLPAARTVRPYFRSMAAFTTWNQDGIAVQMHGPIPLAGVFMVAAAVAVPYMTMSGGTAMPLPGAALRRAERVRGPREVRADPARPVRPGPAAPPRLARVQVEQLSSYVRVFLLTENRFPTSLQELVEKDVTGNVPKDPWGRDYALRIHDEKTRKFAVVSAGPDGAFDTEDDVKSGR